MDVIKYNDNLYCAKLVKNNESFGAVCYDRTYKLYNYDELVKLQDCETLTDKELDNVAFNVDVFGTTKLPFEVVTDIAPVAIEEVKTYKVKVAKPQEQNVQTWKY